MKKILNLFVILSTSFLLVACGSSGPESVAESFVKNLYEGSADDAMAMLHIAEKDKRAGVESMMKGKLEGSIAKKKTQVQNAGGISGYQTLEAVMKDDSNADVKIIVTFKDKTTEIEEIHVVKVNGDWKIRL